MNKIAINNHKTTTSYCFGYKIYFKDNSWYYFHNDELIDETTTPLKCKECGMTETESGVDPCIGVLEGVSNACCGHGIEDECYIQFTNGTLIGGSLAKDILISKSKESKE